MGLFGGVVQHRQGGAAAVLLHCAAHAGSIHNFAIRTTYNDDNDIVWHAERVQYSSISTHGMQQAAQDMGKVCAFHMPKSSPE